MQISTTSWHYRFMSFMGLHPRWRFNLCSYIRGFMLSLIKLGFYTFCTLVAAAFALFFLYSMSYALLAGLLDLDTTSLQWLLGAMSWGFAAIVGIVYVGNEVNNRRVYKAPGPLKQYLIDRHNKVCRMIQFS